MDKGARRHEVKTDFTQSHQRFDQCGIEMLLFSVTPINRILVTISQMCLLRAWAVAFDWRAALVMEMMSNRSAFDVVENDEVEFFV